MEDQRMAEAWQQLDEECRRRYGHGLAERISGGLTPRTAKHMNARTATILAAALVQLDYELNARPNNLCSLAANLWRRAQTHESTVQDLLSKIGQWVPGGVKAIE